MFPKSFKKLEERKDKGLFRELKLDESTIDFYSNDYLGISKELKNYSFHLGGSTGSRLISGNYAIIQDLETKLATFFQRDSALFFNSGYDANLGVFSSIASRNDFIIYDEFAHASMRDGISLGKAQSFSFKHNSIIDLEKKIAFCKNKNPEADIFLAIESLYSMDGDFSPLKEISDLCERENVFLIVDEAHSAGFLGEGKGLVQELGIKTLATIVTFGKAFGAHGAAVLGDSETKDFLVNFARSFIYTTSAPESQIEAVSKSLVLIQDSVNRSQLEANISLFRSLIDHSRLISDDNSPIQVLKISNLETGKQIVKNLEQENVKIKLVLAPTVPKGSERIRICLHAFNTKEEILKLCNYLV